MNGIRTENYDIKIDVKKGMDGKIISGLEIGDILRQNQALIMVMHKGELKENPVSYTHLTLPTTERV